MSKSYVSSLITLFVDDIIDRLVPASRWESHAYLESIIDEPLEGSQGSNLGLCQHCYRRRTRQRIRQGLPWQS